MGSSGSLNHIYRTVWNQALGAMVAVAEISTSGGKASGSSGAPAGCALSRRPAFLRATLSALAIALAWSAVPTSLFANPAGGVAIQGQATFATNGSNLLVTTQNGAGLNHSAINWQSFSIPTGSRTYFQQPSAASTSINRVVTNTPSLIFGTLGSNGNLVLVNQSGITVGAGAVVDTAGFTASALRMSDADALSGRLRFGDASPATGAVSVMGSVLARSGDVVLMGSSVDTGSSALVQAPNGSTVLAAGQQIEITGRGLEGIVMQVQAPADNAVNLGTLKGDAVGIFAGTLKHSGLIQATTATMEGGRVVLKAASLAEVAGAVTANGTTGGSVELAVAHAVDGSQPGLLIHSAALEALGSEGSGGRVSLSADTILSGAEISVDGATVGGQVSVQADGRALATSAAHYRANGGAGAGGNILVVAQGSNYSSASYVAGGISGGVVTLAGNEIKLAGTQVDVSASHGGGAIRIGGLMHGGSGFGAQGYALRNADTVYANSFSSFKANALQSGDGGQVSLWSDSQMRFSGKVQAKGGGLGGNGGLAEISGLKGLAFNGLVDLSATRGLAGTLLLDPHNISVVAGAAGWNGAGDVAYQELIDPTPGAGEGFGAYAKLMMSNGEVVVASPLDSAGGVNAGAVYFFNTSGGVDATLIGAAGDRVGSGGLQLLGGMNVDKMLVISPVWSSGGIDANAKGAVTWVNGATGALSSGALAGPQFVGTVGSTNSVTGLNAGDRVGYNPYVGPVTVLASGNYVIQSPLWGSAGVSADGFGAVTWVNGSNGTLSDGVASGGAVSSQNSLVGGAAGDSVGMIVNSASKTSGVFEVGANLMVVSNAWANAGAVRAGAVTWMSGSTGQLHPDANGAPVYSGVVSSANSLVGTAAGDNVGVSDLAYYDGHGLFSLNNGNYLIRSSLWGSGGVPANALGAVTWFGGAAGVVGPVSAANSVVGSSAGDQVGKGLVDAYTNDPGVVVLPNNNYVVVSSRWGGGKGAVTWGDGSTGSAGQIAGASQATAGIVPSVVGSGAGDFVGAQGIQVQLGGGSNFLIKSPWFDGGGALDPNGNALTDSGALTWVNGLNGTLTDTTSHGAVVSAANSLVGSYAYDNVSDALALNSANFLAKTPVWASGVVGGAGGVGAITWISGASGKLSDGTSLGGSVSAANSVVGISAGDNTSPVIIQLTGPADGKLLIHNPGYNSGGNAPNAGAITWMDGGNGHLSNGTTGGVISPGITAAGNSLVGSSTNEYIGAYVGYPQPWGSITQLSNGNVIVATPAWDNGGQANAGAITWMSGINGLLSNGASGAAISAANSLIGGTAGDALGSAGIYTNAQTGNVLVQSYTWTNPNAPSTPIAGAGAISWINGSNGRLVDLSVGGLLTAGNSLVGDTANGNLGGYNPVDLLNGNLVLRNPAWQGYKGASTWVNTATGKMSDGSALSGLISSSNSIVGSAVTDQVGYEVTVLAGSNYVVHSAFDTAGALTWVNGTTGLTHDGLNTITAANSLLGGAGDYISNTGTNVVSTLGNGNVVFANQNWGGGRGAVTWMDASNGQYGGGSFGGLVSASNSLVGSLVTDGVGRMLASQSSRNGASTALANGAYVVASPDWNNGAGAVTLGNGLVGTTGVVSAANSLVGSATGDNVGFGGVAILNANAFLVSSPHWGSGGVADQGLGAVTHVNTALSKVGAVSSQNSLVGSLSGDQVGLSSAGFDYRLQANGNVLINSQYWNGGIAGGLSALTWISGSTGKLSDGSVGGTVGASNSLLGSSALDNLGSGYVTALSNGNWVISSPSWGWSLGQASGYGKGAAIWMNGSSGQLADTLYGGVVSSTNSLVGSVAGDAVGGLGFCDCSFGGGITALSNGNYIVNSPNFNGQLGALTWANGSRGLAGLVGSSNSVTMREQSVFEAGSSGKVLVGAGTGNAGRGAVYVLGAAGALLNGVGFSDSPSLDFSVGADWLANSLSLGTNLVLQANNDIAVNAAINVIAGQTAAGALTLQAGRSIALNANISSAGGNVTLVANDAAADGVVDAFRDAGAASLTLGANTTLSAGTGNISLKLLDGAGNANNTTGTIAQGAGSSMVANSLDVQSFGGMSLTGNNLVGSFAASNTGSAAIQFNNAGALVLGSLSRAGVSNTLGSIKITASGDLSLTPQYGYLSSGAGASAVVLATSGNFLDGGNQISTANGRWLVYSTDPRLDSLNPQMGLMLGAGDFKQYAVAAGTAVAQATGNGFLYSLAPSVTVGLISPSGGFSKTYDRTSAIALASTDFTTTLGAGFSGLTDVLTVVPMTGNFNSQHVGLATGVTATGMGFASAVDGVTGATVYGYQMANTTTASAPGSISPVSLTWTTPTLTKTYDGTLGYVATNAQLATFSAGLLAGDTLGSVTLAYANKNAGVGTKAANISGFSINDGNGGSNYTVTPVGNTNSTIDKAVVTLAAPSITKTYDGTTAYTSTAADLLAMSTVLASGDSVAAASLAYTDKNAGSGNKAVSLGTFSINDGNGGNNYTVTPVGNSTSTINPLTQVTWSSGVTNGNWSDPASWTGNLVPDGGNVLAVSVLNGAAVTYDLTTPTTVQAINMTGSFTMATGSLSITGNLSTPQYIQTGGALTGTGALTVTNSFSQTAGSIAMAGPVSITQASGNLVAGSISGSSISLAAPAGSISQAAPLVTAGLLKATASNGIALNDAANAMAAFSAATTGSGNIALTNAVALDVQGITVANGNAFIDNTGAVSNSGVINAGAGTVDITAHSPITIGNTVTASGNITLAALTQDGTSNITLNGAMTSTAGGISIQAYNNFIQNSNLSAALAIDVSTIAGSLTFGPGAYSIGNPVMYTVNGAPYMPPWIASTLSGGATDFVVAFLDQFQAVLDAQQVASIDDPLGLKQRGLEGIVVEGEICKP